MTGKELLKYGWFYRARVLETSHRSEWELPLSAIVFVLGHSGIRSVEALLIALSTSQSPQIAWLAGLSRRLWASRTSSHIELLPQQQVIWKSLQLKNLIQTRSSTTIVPVIGYKQRDRDVSARRVRVA